MQRMCQILGKDEQTDLTPGLDFRLPEYRREVFLRFYEFHTKYKAHPGAVYYTFPHLFELYGMSMEQKLWFCFINGLSQNVISTWRLWEQFPNFAYVRTLEGRSKLSYYFRTNYEKFGWDTDRRYVKNQLEKCIESYINLVGEGTQVNFFSRFVLNLEAKDNFMSLWNYIMENFYLFGRLSTFSYMEYLHIAGVHIACPTLFLDDINGSKSHRNGLCKVLGRDDLDWHQSNPDFDGKYNKETIQWLEKEAEQLIEEADERFPGASYFTLESTLCCYKSWHRKNRRYPNVYNDMFYQRILRDEMLWEKPNELFRKIRKECLPSHLRMEDNPKDPGLKPEKQNHYLNTGQVIMMDEEWPCFQNDFNDSLKIKIPNGQLFL